MSMTNKFKNSGDFLLGEIQNTTGQNPVQLVLGVPFSNRGRDQTVTTHPLPMELTLKMSACLKNTILYSNNLE